MADPGGTSSEQLEAAKQLTEAIKNFASLTEKNNSLLRSQLEITRQISSYSKTVSDTTTTTTQSLNDAAESVDRLNNSSLEDLVSQLDDVNDKAEESRGIFSKIGGLLGKVIKGAALVGAFAIEKFFSILKGIYSIGKTVVSTLFSIVGVIWDLGKALLSIPFKAFDWLVAKAQSMGGGGNEYAQAIQNIKKEYGDLNQIAPKTIMSMARNTASLAEVGIKARRVYGNLGERMKEMLEFSQKLGPLFESFAGELEETGLKIPTLAKGMGLADEQALTVAQRAKTLGIKMQDQFLNIHKMSWTLGKNYGNATKLLNRDVAIAMKDVKRFGGATEAQMMGAAVYARSLGLELDKISGILDAFDTFEGAADVASKLAQTWGVQIDPFALLNEQDPVAIVDAIKQGFANSGKDITQFNRAEKDLLSQLTKLSPEITQQALSLHNQGVALEDVMKDANTASKSFSTLDGALEQLRGSIELIVQSGSMPQFTGFFDAWWQGIQRGIELNPQFRGLFRDIRQGLRFTFYDAKRVFDAFVENFPGVKDMIQGLREIFNPAKIGGLIRGINNEIISFLRNLKEGKVTFSSLMSGITKQFENYLGGAEKGGSRFLEGLGAFGETVAKIAGSIIEWIGSVIADGIGWLTKFINDPMAYINPVVDGTVSAAKAVGEGASSIWAPMWEGLNKAWTQISTALAGLAEEIASQLPLFREFLELFEDSNRVDESGQKMSNLKVKILDFWKDIKESFQNVGELPVVKQLLGIFESLKGVIGELIVAISALGVAQMAMGLAGPRAGAIAKGVLGVTGALAGGVTAAVATGVADREDIISDENLKRMKEFRAEAARIGLSVGDTVVGLGQAGANAVGEFGSWVGPKISEVANDIDSTLNLSGLAQDAKDKLIEAKTLIGSFKAEGATQEFIDNTMSRVTQLVQDAKSTIASGVGAAARVAATATVGLGSLSIPTTSSTAPTIPAAPTPPSPQRIIPPFAAVASLSFDDISKSINYLSETIGTDGKSTIVKLVKSLKGADNIIGANKAQDAAKNVSTFFGHVEEIATALGGMQSLVSVGDAAGESNFKKVEENLNNFEKLFGQLTTGAPGEDSVLAKIVGHIKTLEGLIPEDAIINKVKEFFDTLTSIALNLKNVSTTDIDTTKIITSLKSFSVALDAVRTGIGPVEASIGLLSSELDKKGAGGQSIASKLKGFLSNFKPFVSSFKEVAGGLKEIAGLSAEKSQFSSVDVETGIKNVADSISALTSKKVGVGGTHPSPLGELDAKLNSSVSEKSVGGFSVKTEFSGISPKLKVLKDELVKITSHIGDTSDPKSIVGALDKFAYLSALLKPEGSLGSRLNGATFAPIGALFDSLQKDLKVDTDQISQNFQKFSEALTQGGFKAEVSKIEDAIMSVKSAGDLLANIPSVATSFNSAAQSVAKFAGFGGPYSIDSTQVTFEINLNVNLNTTDVEYKVISDSKSIVKKLMDEALTDPTTPKPDAVNAAVANANAK
jgi:hypothetical protein